MEELVVVSEPGKKKISLQEIFLVFLRLTVVMALGQAAAGPIVSTAKLVGYRAAGLWRHGQTRRLKGRGQNQAGQRSGK